MKQPVYKPLILLALLALLIPGQASATHGSAGEQQEAAWTPGNYAGWVYFLEKSEMDYFVSTDEMTIEYTYILYHESHGDLDCTIFDASGNGTCGADFPLEKIATGFGSMHSKDCNLTLQYNANSLGVSGGPSLSTLSPMNLSSGFSYPFIPRDGVTNATLAVTGGGSSPGCQPQTLTSQPEIGIKQWPNLDFHTEFHTALTAGGSCSMDSFPRQMSTGHGQVTATIEQCYWRIFQYDPYAQFPKE